MHDKRVSRSSYAVIARCVGMMSLVLSTIFISGCMMFGNDVQEDMETEIMSKIPVIGWFWRSHPSVPREAKDIDNISDNDSGYTSKLPDIPSDDRCPKVHQYWNMQYGVCVCEPDYYMQDDDCILKSSRECVVDRDCSPDGRLSVCYGAAEKRVYYCDLATYTCAGGKGKGVVVDCKAEYGPDYRCAGGECVE